MHIAAAEPAASPLRVCAAEGAAWTVVGDVASLVRFLCTRVLARLLAPESFSLLAIGICVIGFTRTFQDARINQAIMQKRRL
jgi:O-antigen/teichoic acid export membrane protein